MLRVHVVVLSRIPMPQSNRLVLTCAACPHPPPPMAGGSFTDAARLADMHPARTPSPTKMGRQHSGSMMDMTPSSSQDGGVRSASRHQQMWQAVCCTGGGDVHTVTLACSPALGHGSWHATAQVRRRSYTCYILQSPAILTAAFAFPARCLSHAHACIWGAVCQGVQRPHSSALSEAIERPACIRMLASVRRSCPLATYRTPQQAVKSNNVHVLWSYLPHADPVHGSLVQGLA